MFTDVYWGTGLMAREGLGSGLCQQIVSQPSRNVRGQIGLNYPCTGIRLEMYG